MLNFWQHPFMRDFSVHGHSALYRDEWIWALIVLVLGLILLLMARRVYRWIIAADVIALGWVLAMMVAGRSILTAVAVVVAAVIVAIAIVPMLEIAFALVGAVAGCLMGIAASRWMHSPPGVQWIPAMVGLVCFGVIAFFVFRAALIFAFTLQGAAMVLGGSLLLIRKFGPISWNHWILHTRLLKPTAVSLLTLGLACVGILYQQWQWGMGKENAENGK